VAHSASAKKRHRQSLSRQERNRSRVTAARSAVRKARELMAAGAAEEAQGAVREAVSILDRAARKGVLHANNAARRKHRLMRQVNALQAGAEGAAAPKRRARTATKAGAAKGARKSTGRATRAKKS